MPTAELSRPSRRRSDSRENGFHDPSHRRGQPSGLRPGASAEANGIAALFSAVRPFDGLSRTTARSAVTTFDGRASATAWILERGLRQLDPRESRRIVDSWSALGRSGWPSLISDEGCNVRIGDSVVTGAVRVALLDWLPLARTDLAVYEAGLFRHAPANALALLVRPPTIWSIDDALTADRLFPRGPRFEPERFDALESYARERIGSAQLGRVRGATAKVERQLPAESFPRASATIAAGCAVIARDDASCAAIATQQLARYATSELIGRGAS